MLDKSMNKSHALTGYSNDLELHLHKATRDMLYLKLKQIKNKVGRYILTLSF